MSDSYYKLTTSSRRKPSRQRPFSAIQENKTGGGDGKRYQRKKAQLGMVFRKPQSSKTSHTNSIADHDKKSTTPPPIPDAYSEIPSLEAVTGKLPKIRVRKQGVPKRVRVSRKGRLKPMARTILYVLRLLIVGVGIGAIMGTVLSVLNPAKHINKTDSTNPQRIGQTQAQINQGLGGLNKFLFLSQEILPLKSSVENLLANNTKLTPGIFLVDLDNGNYVDFNAANSFPAASTIKMHILVAFFQDIDNGKIRLYEQLTMEKGLIVGGSGNMGLQKPGTKFTALEVATRMMTTSDNTATNMLIKRMGGIDILNQRFRSWGLAITTINNLLPDLKGTNITSPKELGELMAMVSKGNLVTMRSRDRIMSIMRRNTRNNLLPAGLPKGATIAHKTGDIGSMLADAGLIDLPTGKRYLAVVMVQRPYNDPSAETLIKSVSRIACQQFSRVSKTWSNSNLTSVTSPSLTMGL